jgi:hypothetical protein
MDTIDIPPTGRSPLVHFSFQTGQFRLSGESYPENAAGFFGPLMQQLRDYLDEDGPDVTFSIELSYFNSSSAKALMNIFELLEQAAERGRKVQIDWCYAPDDDTMEEFGEDFAEDIHQAVFVMRPLVG